MFLGRNRLGMMQAVPNEEGTAEGITESGVGFLNLVDNMPVGMKRFLARKGINSYDDLFRRVQGTAPRMIFRR